MLITTLAAARIKIELTTDGALELIETLSKALRAAKDGPVTRAVQAVYTQQDGPYATLGGLLDLRISDGD